MKIAKPALALVALAASGGMPARANAAWTHGAPVSPTLEIESQVPCFFFGGYHLAAGVRYRQFRLRASVIDSGRFDLEPFGLDNQKSSFERSIDDGSFRVYGDYFLSDRWYVDALAGSHRWIVRSKAASATAHLRTLDGGVGVGFQYFVYRFYVEPAVHLFFRERRTLEVAGEDYRIAGVEWNGAIRLGVRL